MIALLASPLIRYALLALGLMVAVFAWDQHERHVGAEHLLAKEQAKTEQEHQRRLQSEQAAQAQAQADAARIAAQEKKDASLIATINRLSRAHDRAVCLSAGSVRRLNEVGHSARR